jgi:hypothetical protein
MKIMQFINKRHEVVGQVRWAPPHQIQVDIADATLAAGLNALIDEACENGLLLHGGGPRERNGQMVFVEKIELVKADDERFLHALADAINRVSFAGQRVFGLVKDTEVRHI